ncbi:hypothetical protein DFP72DRAFT_1032067 [Ephemerocybe angulata]|uniref:Shugoshin C-terminal domain-containing protein n=1 Tax=Ephemerocybe angulata TaxID=980116 RepID=A0A8H6MAY1_9AGAR|nr:hypothetical protein DFP72DRAFT_1032067 [Tulosesus angulatus]
MSRRESRASTGARQTDALYEFETFKKKFLLANKHITKLNSTLSVRIEELNAQIHALNVENLRLRTSELQLASELKREREKSRKVMADAEIATLNLTKHLNYLRTSLEITRSPPPFRAPPSPKAKRRPPPPDPTEEPEIPRIARPPTVPGIHEEDEPSESESKPSASAKRKSSVRRRLSASNLPVATNRISTPPPHAGPSEPSNNNGVVHMDLSVAVASSTFGKRKPTRRQSGLLTVNTQPPPRPASPAFGSPVRLEAGRAELREELAAVNGDMDVLEDEEEERKTAKRRPSKSRVETTPMPASKERKRRREEDDAHLVTVEAITAKLKNVTTGRTALQPIDNTIHDPFDDLVSQGKQFLAAHHRDSLSPSPVISAGSVHSETEGSQDAAGRERRARKSVNYAEPKLNTKMRRPESEEPRKKRTSAAAVMSRSRESSENPEPEQEVEIHPAPVDAVTTMRRKKSRPQMYHDDEEESDGADVDEEYAPPGSKKPWSNINIDGRRGTSRRGTGSGEEGRRHSLAV